MKRARVGVRCGRWPLVTLLAAAAPAGLLPCGAAAAADAVPAAAFLRGADVSALDRLDVRGAVFRDGPKERSALAILGDAGFDTLVLTVLVDPETGFLGVTRSADMGARIHGAGFALLADLRFADAAEGALASRVPRRWAAKPDAELETAVRRWASETLEAFRATGARPELVRVGADLAGGFLGERGAVSPDSGSAAWDRCAVLLHAALDGIETAAPDARTILPLEHGDIAWSLAVVDSLAARDVRFDRIGVSWRPWYRGTLEELRATLEALARRAPDGVMVLDTAYPWTLRGFDGTLDEVGQPAQLHPGYPATPEGQARWLADVVRIVQEAGGNGVVWGEPVSRAARGVGSSAENLALFDDSGGALPALVAGR